VAYGQKQDAENAEEKQRERGEVHCPASFRVLRVPFPAPLEVLSHFGHRAASVTSGPIEIRPGRPHALVMTGFLLWLLLLIVCWPLALLALVLYPFVWLLSLPFRLVGIAVGSVFELLHSILMLPARVLRGPPR
jgi:hypothetical protein